MQLLPLAGSIWLVLVSFAPRAVAQAALIVEDRSGADRVLLDGSEPEALWARGERYKARFDASGARFVPFLGSDAPRNVPLDLRVRAVTVGGVELAHVRDVAPRLADDTIHYERGAFVELYHLRAEGIEQAFRFDAPLAPGELTIRVAVASELSGLEDEQGIAFGGPLGGVRYGRATAFDANGLATAAPVRLVGDELEIRVPGAFLAQAAWPVLVDPLIASFALDDSAADDRQLDVAYDASLDLYAVCWQRRFSFSDHDVHGKLIDAAGNTVREFAIDVTGFDNTRPKIAGIDALDQFLVATLEGHASLATAYTRTIDLIGGQVVVGPRVSQLSSCVSIDLGGDAGSTPPYRYCLVAGTDFVGGFYVDVRLVESNGGAGPFFFFGDSDTSPRSPRVSKCARGSGDAQRAWGLAWVGEPWVGVQAGVIHLDASYDTFWSVGPGDHVEAVSSKLEGASGDLPFLVVFRRAPSPGVDTIHGRVMRDGEAVTPEVQLGARQDLDDLAADADSDGSSFVVALSEREETSPRSSIQATTWQLSGEELVLSERVALSDDEGEHDRPALTSTRSGGGAPQRFLAAWHELDGGQGDARGALYDSPGPGVRYCIGAPNSVGAGARLHAAGSISIALNEFELAVDGCPPNRPGIFFLGLDAIQLPFGEGFRCVGDPTRRVEPVVTTDAAGRAALSLDFDAPYGNLVTPGAPGVNYQFWYRDPAGGPAAFNLSDALHVEHTP